MNSSESYVCVADPLCRDLFLFSTIALARQESGCILMRHNIASAAKILAATRCGAHKYSAYYSLDIKKKFPESVNKGSRQLAQKYHLPTFSRFLTITEHSTQSRARSLCIYFY